MIDRGKLLTRNDFSSGWLVIVKQIVYEPMLGGGFITASAPILIASFGVVPIYMAGLTSIVVALGIAYFSGWIRFSRD